MGNGTDDSLPSEGLTYVAGKLFFEIFNNLRNLDIFVFNFKISNFEIFHF